MEGMKTARNVLIVEDNPANILVATALLDKFGYSYVVAKSGDEALEKFKSFSFELILMDIQMPDLDGVTTTRLIRDLEKANDAAVKTPIVAMTANYASKDLGEWQKAGIEDLIPKPVNVNYLDRMLGKYCTKAIA